MGYSGEGLRGSLYAALLLGAGLGAGCTPSVNSYTLFASLPAAKSAEQITGKLERAVVLDRRVNTQSSTITLDELFPILMSTTFGSKITLSDGINVYQQSSELQGGVDNTIDVNQNSKTYSFFFNPQASTNQGVSGVLVYDSSLHRSDVASTISKELNNENRDFRVVQYATNRQTIVVSFPKDETATSGFESLLRPFGEVYDVRLLLPQVEGVEGPQHGGNEGGGPPDPENPGSPGGD